MSHVAPISSGSRTSRIAKLSAALRQTWNEARYTDRRLMEMRTNLSRHSG